MKMLDATSVTFPHPSFSASLLTRVVLPEPENPEKPMSLFASSGISALTSLHCFHNEDYSENFCRFFFPSEFPEKNSSSFRVFLGSHGWR